MNMKRGFKGFTAMVLALTMVLAMTAASADGLLGWLFGGKETTIRIGTTDTVHAEILNSDVVKDKMAGLGYTLEVVVYDGYVQQNTAVSEGTDMVNYFQHRPYLGSYNETVPEDEQLAAAFAVNYEPFGIYSDKIMDLSELQDGAKIGLPIDPVNETRALMLLAAAGLIEVPEGTDANSIITRSDITAEMNPRGFELVEVNAALLPFILVDYAIAVTSAPYAVAAGFRPADDALVLESPDSPFAALYTHIVAVRPENLQEDWVLALGEVLRSEEVRQFMLDTCGGSILPVE